VLCHPEDASSGKEAARLGAEDVLVAPFNEQQVEAVIRRHLAPAANGQGEMARERFETLGPAGFFVSSSPVMQKLRAQAELLAQADVPVLILGEPGTGKYTVASLIHRLSVRSGFRLLRVNCAEMPETLLEAELFGEGSGPSAGVRGTSVGKFAAGEKGTIYLDEITEMPEALQARLLQVLQNQSLQNQGLQNPGTPSPGLPPNGSQLRGLQNHNLQTPGVPNHGLLNKELRSTVAVPADVRILAASSAHLGRALAERRLREDLYYRLSAFTMQVPPLRQRKDEIAILLRYLMHKLAKHYNLPPRGFSASVLHACQRYSWPGNLQELETFVKRYLVAGDHELTLSEMGLDSMGLDAMERSEATPDRMTPVAAGSWEERELGRTGPEPESLKSLIQGIKSEAEQNAIGAALKRTGWNRKAAARLLRVSYRTLLYKIEQYHMQAPEPFLSRLPVEDFSVQGNGSKGSGKAS